MEICDEKLKGLRTIGERKVKQRDDSWNPLVLSQVQCCRVEKEEEGQC